MPTLNDAYAEGEAFANVPPLSQPLAMEIFTDVFAHSDSIDALMNGLNCGEANAVIDLLRAMHQPHMAEVALTAHAARDDDPDDAHYLTEDGFGRYKED